MSKIITQIKAFVKETDKFLLLLCISLSALGILMVSSATHSGDDVLSRDGTVMLVAVAIGLVLALTVSVIDYNFIIRLWPLIGAACLALMLVLFIPGVGAGPPERPDVKTWIKLGDSGLYFQPSELVKLGFIITFSAHLDLIKENLNTPKNILLLCLHAAVPTGLVIVSGDMGSALIFMIIFISMMFTAGVSAKFFLIGALLAALGAYPAWTFVLSSIQKDRIYALFDHDAYPDIIYQQEQGLKAIKNGGLFGTGLFNGDYTQSGSVPENENDMIFSVIGEELGLIAAIAVLAVFVVISLRIVNTGRKSRDDIITLLCSGVGTMIAAQVIINIGMCLELLPVVGITLPFLSAGGSSNLCIYIAVGLVLSIRRHTMEQEIESFRIRNISKHV